MQINELARAKINLCLHVIGQRDDGYHLLDSIVAFADIGDEISVTPSNHFRLTITGPYADELSNDEDNLVLRAARLFSDNCDGADITLTKNLPVASGIGGGSADAAATLHAMSHMTGVRLPRDFGLSLGADVPVCLTGTTCKMQGIGEVIKPLADFPTFYAVLVCPKAGVATPVVFNTLQSKENSPVASPPNKTDNALEMMEFLKEQRNDLERPAIGLNPVIGRCLTELTNTGATLARMSGSGATCFGLFEDLDHANAAAKTICENHPDWWVKSCCIGN
jgi:4-diphosphocytidyl-2-C-methyl-D-erythritol kinase